ncbi:MAG: hypothetical protein U1F65_09240 [Verrucomicrobiota bacterium]
MHVIGQRKICFGLNRFVPCTVKHSLLETVIAVADSARTGDTSPLQLFELLLISKPTGKAGDEFARN